jgi:hypothetical protein
MQQHPLMSRFLQGVDLLFLPLWRKDELLLHTAQEHVADGGFGIVEASLPLADGAARDPRPLGQASLRQTNARAQLEHNLPKGIVAFPVRVPRHRCAPLFARDPAPPREQSTGMGGKLLPAAGCLTQALPVYC